MIEDSLHGITAARQAGMACVGLQERTDINVLQEQQIWQWVISQPYRSATLLPYFLRVTEQPVVTLLGPDLALRP